MTSSSSWRAACKAALAEAGEAGLKKKKLRKHCAAAVEGGAGALDKDAQKAQLEKVLAKLVAKGKVALSADGVRVTLVGAPASGKKRPLEDSQAAAASPPPPAKKAKPAGAH